MGTADIKAAWNAIAPDYPAQRATLGYERVGLIQQQVITISGVAPDGTAFSVKTDPHDPGLDTLQVAADAARQFLSSTTTTPTEQK